MQAMMDGIMNLCRVKFRDHQRLQRGPLPEYSVPTHQGMGAVPRAGNDSGGGQLGNAIRCKPGGTNDFIYIVVQEAVWEALAKRVGPEVGVPDLATDPKFAHIENRRRHQSSMWEILGEFALKHDKREMMRILGDGFEYAAKNPTMVVAANVPWRGGRPPFTNPFRSAPAPVIASNQTNRVAAVLSPPPSEPASSW